MNESIPFFSIIVPVYNIESYVERTIMSILKNNFKDYEVIFVNDGSTDKSFEIIQRFINNKNFFCVSQKNGGLSAARNSGLQVARGKYIIFLDGDDFIAENSLSVFYKVLIADSIDLLVFGRIENYEDRQVVPYRLSNKNFNSSNLYLLKSLQKSTFRTNVWDKIYRRELIEKNNLRFVEGLLYEDMFFLLQYLAVSNKIKVIEQPLYFYTCSNQTSITKLLRKKDLDILIFIQKAVEFENINNSLSKKSVYTMLQRFALSSIINKYVKYYGKEDIAKEIIDRLLYDKCFKSIVSYNMIHGVSLRDKLFSILIKVNYHFYLVCMKLLLG